MGIVNLIRFCEGIKNSEKNNSRGQAGAHDPLWEKATGIVKNETRHARAEGGRNGGESARVFEVGWNWKWQSREVWEKGSLAEEGRANSGRDDRKVHQSGGGG